MKTFKTILKVLLITVWIYILFVAIESVRLQNGGLHPVIILGGTCDGDKKEHYTNYETDCKGLGYSIRREYVLRKVEEKSEFVLVREEFWLFGKYVLWGWVS